MKKLITLITCTMLLVACNNATKEKSNVEKPAETDTISVYENDEQITYTEINVTELPNDIKYEGKIKNAVRWTDKSGDNIVITTETGIYETEKSEHDYNGEDAELFAYHFIISNNKAKQTWKVYDFIHDCPVDIVASFIDNTFQITDLDHNGVAEIWLMYITVCHNDVSPCDMKIIMYEGQQKFAMRGKNKVMFGIDDEGNEHYIGGEYKYDKAFEDGPKVFLEFAKQLWNENITGTTANKF